MVYRRGRFRRFARGAYRAGRFAYRAVRGGLGVYNTAVGAYKAVQHIKRLMNVEVKHIETTTSGGINSNGGVYPLNLVGQGDTSITRNGDSIKPLSLTIKGYFSVGSADEVVRTMLILDKQNRGATPSVSDILESVSVNSGRNLDNLRRFKVLFDKRTTVQTSKEIVPFTIHKKFKKIHLYYSDGDADAAALKDYALFVLYMTSSDPATDTQVSSIARLSFTDN